jgi:hypothetical protein
VGLELVADVARPQTSATVVRGCVLRTVGTAIQRCVQERAEQKRPREC